MATKDVEAKWVDDDGDFDDDVAPVKKDGGILSRGGSGLGLGALAKSAHNLKEIEEATVRGDDVEVRFTLTPMLRDVQFTLPDGKKVSGKFPMGQDVMFLKAFITDRVGIPLPSQIFTLNGTVMIDPLSLRDYSHAIGAGHTGPVNVIVTLAAEAK